MSPEEAKWFSSAFSAHEADVLSPLLNLGSSTADYREKQCPYSEETLFAPLSRRGIKIVHADPKSESGVDFVGDILDPNVLLELRNLGVKSILSSNMLEHVKDIESVCHTLVEICPQEGLLGISVPYKYPYHPDPVDNGFRPSLQELEGRLATVGFRLIRGEIVNFGNYASALHKNPRLLLRDMYLCVAGIFNKEKRRVFLGNYGFLLKPYQVTCAIFKRV